MARRSGCLLDHESGAKEGSANDGEPDGEAGLARERGSATLLGAAGGRGAA